MTLEPPSQGWNADLYRTRASFVPRLGLDLVEVLAPRRGERILDLGCGTGELTSSIAASAATVVGLDASPDMIAAARLSAPAIEFVAGDGQALRYAGEFDAVFSNAALHWMPRADDVATGIARALRPGGRFVAEFGGHGCVARVRTAVTAALRRHGRDPTPSLGWYFPTLAEYVGVLAAAGLTLRFAHLFDRPTPLEGEDAVAAWIRMFLPRLEAELGADWPAFVREVETLLAPSLRRAGAWVFDYVRLRVVAERP